MIDYKTYKDLKVILPKELSTKLLELKQDIQVKLEELLNQNTALLIINLQWFKKLTFHNNNLLEQVLINQLK